MKVRNFLKNKRVVYSFMAGALAVLLLLAGLPACAPAAEEEGPAVGETAYDKYVASLSEGEYPVPRECFDQAQKEGELNLYNWGEWWPAEIREGFAQEFGIAVTKDDFGDADEMITKFRLNPETPYDITLPGLRGFYQLKGLDILQEINHDWIPNVNKYLPEMTKNAEYDPNYKYSAATDMCITTYGYNTEYVDDPRIPSWSAFYEPDEKYKGKIIPLNNMYEVIGGALLYLGYPFNSDDEDELMAARDLLLQQKPYVLAYDSWPIREVLAEEAWIFQ